VNKSRVLLSILFTLAVVPAARAAPAQAATDVCVRQAEGLPYESRPGESSAPEWWNESFSASKKEGRWTGATSRASGQGAAPPLARARTIWDKSTGTVFFELTVNGDPSLDQDEDLVLLALSDSSGTEPELFIKFAPLGNCSPQSNCTSGVDSSLATSNIEYTGYTKGTSGASGSWGTLVSQNPGTSFVVGHPWVKIRSTGSAYDWTLSFTLKVPVENGDIRSNLRIYGSALMFSSGPYGWVTPFPLLCNPSSDGTGCELSDAPRYQDQIPIATLAQTNPTWPVLRSKDPSSCSGVEIIRELVGSGYNVTRGKVPGTEVGYDLPGTQIPRTTGTTLRAGFYNGTGAPIPAGGIEAEFYIADWGAQYSSFDKSATWKRILSQTPITLDNPVMAGRYAGEAGQGKIESGVWIPKDAGLDNPSVSHQCMFVRLKSTKPWDPQQPDKPNVFKVDSVYRNMDLVTASVARRPAAIDLGDRPLPKGKDRHEVYLLVRTQHMPDPTTCDVAKGKLYGCAKGGRILRAQRALNKAQKQALKADFAAGRTTLDQEQLDALLEQKDRKGKKLEELPFVVVYAMVDTGRRIDLPGAPKTPVLSHFSEFGYYVEHEGDLEGWETLMHGAEPVPGVPNLFKLEIEPKKVASVANTVRVLSKETKTCKTRPPSRLGAVRREETEELEAKLLAEVGKGDVDEMGKVRVTDDQLGCDAPPLRMQCRLKDCDEHSPAAFIDGSRYVGDWKGLARRKAARSGKQPDAKQPAAKPPAKPSPAAKPGAKPKAGG